MGEGSQTMTEPTLEDIKREYPDWVIYKATDRRWRARPMSARPPMQPAVGEDLEDLRDEIKRYLSKTEDYRPG